ncbi:dynobactin maturation radical SAM/SPASM protein DynA [Flavihumibacter petaseus]|uniref:Putative sulfatase-maturating enzyme homolog n=1 Tax=Flavihumibacter petaseus NBRC 106054 TaxID=1220578 RepID=A0A0E9N6T6_9BACT|nr:dynobactin maturation radical SAM/SPASM protein DynA [Flavihumibacter petaseus]GAO45406.1 putative sulfatase-maturating enzyme homolog [Flavihumibacter petaseus NBRC 106054]
MFFTNVIKPTHLCNLACKYCYNDDVRDPVMKEYTLRRTIEQTFNYVRKFEGQRLVSFIWHGGEPMIAGLKYFQQAIEFQGEFGHDVKFENIIQTNGTFIDEKWINFFKIANFSISISIDGPASMHDAFRVDRRGRGSYEKVMSAIKMVKDAGLPFGVCVVISKANIDRVEELYDFLSQERLPFNVIPLNKSGSARDHFQDVGLDAEEYADAWIKMYDKWYDSDRDYVYCSDFIYKTRAIMMGRPMDCVGLAQCAGSNISVDPVGDVYPCASLSGHADTKYGNLTEYDLDVLLNSSTAMDYRNRKMDEQCASCKWQHVCHGGCQARAYKFFGDHNRRDYYCPSLFKMYEHVGHRIEQSAIALTADHSIKSLITSNCSQ